MPDGVMTKTEFAAHRGVTQAAVTNWIARQRLTAPSLRDDRKINVALADQQLDAKIDRTLSASAKRRVTTKPKVTPRKQRRPGAKPTGYAPPKSTGGIGPTPPVPRDPALVAQEAAQARLLEARALSASVDAERKRRELQAEQGRYTLAAEAQAAFAKTLSAFLIGVEQSLADLALELCLDGASRVALRRWWRNQRVAAAEVNRLALASTPEFMTDTAA
jgi:hypothetical protein